MFKPARAPSRPVALVPEAPPEGAAAASDQAMDALAGLLRFLREHPLPTGLTSPWEPADAWSQHLTLGTAAPGMGAARLAARREWLGLRTFVTQAREQEQAQISRTVGDLRTGLGACLQTFRESCADESRAGEGIARVLDRLTRSVQTVPPAELKREILGAVGEMRRALDERRARQEAELRALNQRLESTVDELRAAQKESLTDALTRLANRRAFDAEVSKVLRLRSEFRQSATLILVDIDHFKAVNDAHGHPAGDAVLRRLADLLVKSFPRRGDFVGRYGGEEFAVVLAEVPLPAAHQLAARYLKVVRDTPVEYRGVQLRLTASAGVARLAPDESPEAWIARADRALLKAKADGRDRVVCLEP